MSLTELLATPTSYTSIIAEVHFSQLLTKSREIREASMRNPLGAGRWAPTR